MVYGGWLPLFLIRRLGDQSGGFSVDAGPFLGGAAGGPHRLTGGLEKDEPWFADAGLYRFGHCLGPSYWHPPTMDSAP